MIQFLILSLAVSGTPIAGKTSPSHLASFRHTSETKYAQASDLLVPPMVQLGSRTAPNEKRVALVWQTDDRDFDYMIEANQGRHKLKVEISHRSVQIQGIPSHRVYSADVQNYADGSTITYALKSGSTTLATGKFSAPKSDRQPYSFAVFGDFGEGNEPEAKISYQTSLKNPDFTVLTGDMVYGSGRASEYRTNFFPQFLSEVASPKSGSGLFANTLVVGVPGNHDILNRNVAREADLQAYFYYWREPLNGPLTEIGEPNSPVLSGPEDRKNAIIAASGPNYPRMSNFSFDYGNAHWTCIDANPYVNWNDPKLRAWIKDDLAKASKKTWRFIALHQPPFHSSTSHAGEKQIRPLADLFEEGHVDIVFGGHVHNYQRSYPIQVGPKKGASKEELNMNDWPVDKTFDGATNTHPKGIIYIVDGAGGASLYEPEFEQDRSKWLPFQQIYSGDFSSSYVTVKGKTLTLIQTNLDGKEVDRFTIQK
jgi:predicted phosphodiesterase